MQYPGPLQVAYIWGGLQWIWVQNPLCQLLVLLLYCDHPWSTLGTFCLNKLWRTPLWQVNAFACGCKNIKFNALQPLIMAGYISFSYAVGMLIPTDVLVFSSRTAALWCSLISQSCSCFIGLFLMHCNLGFFIELKFIDIWSLISLLSYKIWGMSACNNSIDALRFVWVRCLNGSCRTVFSLWFPRKYWLYGKVCFFIFLK